MSDDRWAFLLCAKHCAIQGLPGKPGIPSLRCAILGLRKFLLSAEHICSAPTWNLRKDEIAQRKLGIQSLSANHWITSSYVDECVQIYDSLPSSLSANVEEQLARIYGKLDKSKEDRGLTLHHLPVQQQSGITDCGVFAVAFAYHAAIGDDLKTITFDQGQLRKHLLHCFEKKELSRFPHKLVRRKVKCKIQFVALHCYDNCKLPESYDNLLGCDSCDQWYHYKCIIT